MATVLVTLTVRDAPKLILTPASMSFAFVTKGLLPAAQDLWISAAPRNLSFSVSGTAGNWLVVTGTGNTPAKLSISVDPSKLNPGTYTGVIVVTSADASNSPQSVQVTLTVTGTAPQLGDSAVFNAAYRDARIAACSVASVYGTNLAQSEGTAQQVPLPFTLGSARVNVNGRPAPMFYASSGQINFQIPCDLTQGPAQVEVNNGIASAYTTVQLKATAPGVYLYENTWAVANNEDGSVHGDDNPAMPGSIVAVYFTGQGLLDGPIAAGDPAPLNRYLCPLAKASATINGQPVEILFVGLSPGSVGLAQVNVRIPDLPAGEYSLVLTVGGVPSNPAILCVKAKP